MPSCKLFFFDRSACCDRLHTINCWCIRRVRGKRNPCNCVHWMRHRSFTRSKTTISQWSRNRSYRKVLLQP
uniref:Uncharacterized protein n=1 Tax=Anopheles funestus TaxID=62324 RepID=A0A182S2A2_ANOFN